MCMLLKLVPPETDKHWSFQGLRVPDEARSRMIAAMHDDETVLAARPFLQGDSAGWVMIEFWTDDHDAITQAAQSLAHAVNGQLHNGPFSRDEVLGRSR